MALCRADHGLGRICRLQLVIGKLGVRSYQRADAMYGSLGTMDLCEQQATVRRPRWLVDKRNWRGGSKRTFTITSVTSVTALRG
jgi:hypothetical protein